MKVLQINSVCGIGSTGRIATDIASMLKENHIDSYIAYGRETSLEDDHVLKIGSKLDCYMHAVLTRMFDNHALQGSERATRNFINQINRLAPDIIHLHNLHGYYINIKILFDYLKKSGKPVVWTLHDCWSFTGHCAHFSYAQCEQWREGCNTCSQTRNYPASAFRDNSQSNYAKKRVIFSGLDNLTLVTPSKWLAGLAEKSFLARYPVKVIPNGIDLTIFQPVSGQAIRYKYNLENKFVILGVSNVWTERKGINYIMKLSKLIKEDCAIVLVGVTDKQMSLLPSNVIGIKKTSDIHQLAQVYAAADVFINPTLEDNFPTVNLEALACGTPVITFDSGGSPEAIDSSCGFVAERGNVNELNNFITVVRSRGKNRYSHHCRKRVLAYYNKQNCFDQYIGLYKQVALGKGGRWLESTVSY